MEKKVSKQKFIISLITIIIAILFVYRIFLTNDKNKSFINFRETDNEIGQFSITWITDNKSGYRGKIDSNDSRILNVDADENDKYDVYNNQSGGVHVTYQLIFNMGGSEDAPVGAIQIRLPKNIFLGRNQQTLTEQILDIPLVEYPETAGTGFNYRYELDEELGEEVLVLENYQVIPSSYAFECSITWTLPTPSMVADGYIREIEAKVNVDMDLNGTPDITSKSNKLTLKYHSHATISNFSESTTTHQDSESGKYINVYEKWNNNWSNTIKPENQDEYVYATWRLYGQVKKATQPYKVTFTSNPIDDLGGEVIGYCKYNSTSTGADSSCFNTSNNSTITKQPYMIDISNPKSYKQTSYYDEFEYIYVMVKYPKNTLQDGQEYTLKNESVITLTGYDGATDTKTASNTIKYQKQIIETTIVEKNVPFNPKSSTSISKTGSSTVYGGINALEGNKEIYAGKAGNKNTISDNFYMTSNVQYYKLTKKEDGDVSNPDDYNLNNWDAILVDDVIILGNETDGYELLRDGDYEITSTELYSFSSTKYVNKTWETTDSSTKVTTINTGWTTEDANVNDLPIAKIYYKKNGEWFFFCNAQKNSSNLYNYEMADGTKYENIKADNKNVTGIFGLALPKGATGVKVITSSKNYGVNVGLNLNINILPSEHVKSIIKNKDSVTLYNYNTSLAQDYKNNYYSLEADSKPKGNQISQTSKTGSIVYETDIENYGKAVLHNSTSTTYTRIKNGQSNISKWVTFNNDTANRRVEANYTTVAYEKLGYNKKIVSFEEVKEYKIIDEQKAGTFYDLLPIGMTVNKDSIKVETLETKDNNYKIEDPTKLSLGTEIPVSISQIENWKGSGRTMLIVKAVISDETITNMIDKGSESEKYILSGFVLKFKGYYAWERISDYGNNPINTIAYKSNTGKLSNGYPDDASKLSSSFTDKDLMTDLDQDGNEHAINDTIYAQNNGTFAFNTASDSFFKTNVKTSSMDEYSDGKEENATVIAGGYYSYRLRYASQKNMTTSDLIIYDVLEDYNGGKKWKGNFVDIDVSQPISKGINPIVYYSIKKPSEINIYEKGKANIDEDLPRGIRNLENNTYWTTEKPQDLTKITAIAIDVGKTSSGEKYLLKNEESIVVTVTMQAPTDNIDSLERENAKAYNAAWWSGTTQQGSEVSHHNFSVYEFTELSISNPNIEISKKAYDLEDTDSDTESIQYGKELLYDLIISNKNENDSLSKVIVSDEIPKNLIINENMSYYVDGIGDRNNTISLKDTSFIKTSIEDNKIELEVSQLLAKETIHILIPTTPIITQNKNINNELILKGYNNMTYEKKTQKTKNRLPTGNLVLQKKVQGNPLNKDKVFEFKIRLISPERYEELKLIREDKKAKEKILENNYDKIKEIYHESIGMKLVDVSLDLEGEKELEENDDINLQNQSLIIDSSINGIYGGITFKNGESIIPLKDGEKLELKDLPTGYYYEIEESDYEKDGYTTTSNNQKGIIKDGETINSIFTNIYKFENPQTFSSKLLFIIISIFFIATGCYHFMKKREKING